MRCQPAEGLRLGREPSAFRPGRMSTDIRRYEQEYWELYPIGGLCYS
ncbi:MAG: hypothetical protein MGG11_19280 [Trichodesmium sp. MAG_R03]|nr:hypothetical protein [Trichodesmium sp. MAG_R03]